MARQKSVPKPNAQCGNEVGESQQRADVALHTAHCTLHTAHCKKKAKQTSIRLKRSANRRPSFLSLPKQHLAIGLVENDLRIREHGEQN